MKDPDGVAHRAGEGLGGRIGPKKLYVREGEDDAGQTLPSG